MIFIEMNKITYKKKLTDINIFENGTELKISTRIALKSEKYWESNPYASFCTFLQSF